MTPQPMKTRYEEARAEANELPTHPLLGRWIACGCGSPTCHRVYPSGIGTFHEGTGFEPDEARKLVAAMKEAVVPDRVKP